MSTSPDSLPRASSIKNFCSRYGMNPSTYYRRLKRGLVPPPRKIGTTSRILIEDEEVWLERLRAGDLAEEVDTQRLVAGRSVTTAG